MTLLPWIFSRTPLQLYFLAPSLPYPELTISPSITDRTSSRFLPVSLDLTLHPVDSLTSRDYHLPRIALLLLFLVFKPADSVLLVVIS